MTDNTRLTLIDKAIGALQTDDDNALDNAISLIRVKCHQSGVNFMRFMFTEVFMAYHGLDKIKVDVCPYCGKDDCKGAFGLRTHVSRIHPERFLEFKQNHLK